MNCKHCGTYSSGKYCPNCGKRIYTIAEANFREYRRAEREFEQYRIGESVGSRYLRCAAWEIAEDKVLGNRKRMVNTCECPDGIADPVAEKAQSIFEIMAKIVGLPIDLPID